MIFALLTLAVMAAFYLCYFLKMFSQRKRGIRTDQMGRGKKGRILYIEVTLKVFSLLMPALHLLAIALDASMLPAAARAAGLALGVFGDTVMIAAVLQMKDSWRAGVSTTDKTDLVTDGVYRYSRNPAFLGFDCMYLGIAIIYCSPWLLAATAAAIAAFHVQITCVEEPFLRQTFGRPHTDYCKQVRRYLGRSLR